MVAVTPPPVIEPVVIYDAIRTDHEWGVYFWTTDGYGTPIDGRPPTPFQKALWVVPFAILCGALITMAILIVVAEAIRFVGWSP